MAYSTIDDPSAYFQIATWTGNDTDGRSITNDGNSDLQPDLVWIKTRSVAYGHSVHDSSRGFGSSGSEKNLVTSNNETENGGSHIYGGVSAASSDGFTTFEGTDAGNPFANNNEDTRTYVAWQWKANGGTRTTNTESGDNPGGGYQANTTSKFSIVDYVGTGAVGTMAHGLGVAPKLIIIKNRDVADSWAVYHEDDGGHYTAYYDSNAQYLALDTTAASVDDAAWWNDTSPTSSVFTINTNHSVNADGENYIAYCWGEVQGFSNFGRYQGQGITANGITHFVYTGFKPAFVMIKDTSATGNWAIVDKKRQTSDIIDLALYANTAGAESSGKNVHFCCNGFQVNNTDNDFNKDGDTYVYVAFADKPLVTSTGIPTTAE